MFAGEEVTIADVDCENLNEFKKDLKIQILSKNCVSLVIIYIAS